MSTPSPVEAIFFAALEKDEGQRAAYLDEACAGQPELRRQVERLLAAHPRVGSFLEKPAVEPVGARAGRAANHTEPDNAPSQPILPLPCPEGSGATQAEALGGDRPALDFLEPSPKPGSLGRLGHYEVLAVVGVGGMGVVLRAFDEKLHRVVAIKVMAAELAASATARRRFTREAQAAAAVCYEHVVTIHAVEEDHRPPYLVMQYVEGVSLQEKLDRTGPLGLREILRIGLQTAEGLAAAHKQGLVHRDVKPANILLENGVERVKLTDFGLARAADDASLTQSGVIAGTPQYMSPEQAEGKPVDHRSDLFSLGSVLYACCTGRPPFRATTSLAVLKRVAEDAPRPVRDINPDVPDWLTAVIDKLHAKDPAQRFQSAAEVADVLSRHLAWLQQNSAAPPPAEPALPAARQPAAPPPRRRWAMVAAALLLLVAGLGLTEAGGVTHVLTTVIRIARPDGTLEIEVDDPDVQVAVDGEEVTLKGAGAREIRLRPGTHEVQATRGGHTVQDQTISVSRGGKSVVRIQQLPAEAPAPAPDAERPIPGPRLQVPTHPEATLPTHIQALLQAHPGPAVTNYVAFTPDGRTLVVANEDGTIQLWDPATHQQIRKWQGPTLKVMDLVVSPDGQRAATASGFWDKPKAGGDAHVWDLASGKMLAFYHEPDAAVMAVAFAPDGETLAVAGFGGAVRLLDAATGQKRATLQEWEPGLGVNTLAFTPDGKRLAAGGTRTSGRGKEAGLVRFWDAATGKPQAEWYGGMGEVQCLRFSPDGRRLAAGCRDHTIHVWDVAEDRERAVMRGHTGIVHSLAFFPGDGSALVSGGLEGTVKVWYVDAGREEGTLTTGMEVVLSVALSPDGHKLAVGGGGWHEPGRVELWDLSRLWPQRRPQRADLPDGGLVGAPPKPPAQAFVILARDGKAERPFATLAKGVAGARGGDTLEVRGDGPFWVDAAGVAVDKPMTIRAGAGRRPVFRLAPGGPGQARNKHLLDVYAPLTLEGLDFDRTGDHEGTTRERAALYVQNGPLRMANCRLRSGGLAHYLVWLRSVPQADVRNCLFAGPARGAISVSFGSDGDRLGLTNCVFAGTGEAVQLTGEQDRQADWLRINLVHNTFSARPLAWSHPFSAGLQVEARGNVVAGDGVIDFLKFPRGPSWKELAKGVRWQGEHNLYPADRPLVALDWAPVKESAGLDAWNGLWPKAEAGTLAAAAKFQGGDEESWQPAMLEPDYWRLAPNSPGKGAGPGDPDLGADVDLVGPGPAYERWKQTPEYQQWLKDTAEARASK
jgi:WD40 repeat protein